MEAELFRLKGELLRMQGAPDKEVHSLFHKALEVSRNQKAKSLELRAAMTPRSSARPRMRPTSG